MGTKLYMGLDLSDSLAQVSFWQEGEKKPVTVSTRKGEEQYQIPTSLYVGKGGYYLYGAEAEKKKKCQKRGPVRAAVSAGSGYGGQRWSKRSCRQAWGICAKTDQTEGESVSERPGI